MRRHTKLGNCLMLAACFLLGSCNQKDDVEEIFVSGQWNLVNYYAGVDWNSNNDQGARPVYDMNKDRDIVQTIQSFTIQFNNDGTLQGNIEKATYTGLWQARPDDRSVSITRLEHPANMTRTSKEFIDKLKAVQFYQGDSKMLRLAPAERTTCIQFRHK